MGFNSAFKGLNYTLSINNICTSCVWLILSTIRDCHITLQSAPQWNKMQLV